jgi:hypothetical protein
LRPDILEEQTLDPQVETFIGKELTNGGDRTERETSLKGENAGKMLIHYLENSTGLTKPWSAHLVDD